MNNSDVWQKCPVCAGTGKVYEDFPFPTNTGSTSFGRICPACQGKRMVSKLTGLPPGHYIQTGNYPPQSSLAAQISAIESDPRPMGDK
jgi:hypothetical protein